MQADMKGLALVPADFRSDEVVTLLRASGHDSGRPTLFICEGLLVYLDLQIDRRLLRGLRSLASAASILAASMAVLREGENADLAAAAANARRGSGGTEPWLTLLPADAYLALLRQTGWEVFRDSDPRELDARRNQSRMILITARSGLQSPVRIAKK
jgi:O-methyltransferase involved in polyketide biosynthesis